MFWLIVLGVLVAGVPLSARWLGADAAERAAGSGGADEDEQRFVRAELSATDVVVPDRAIVVIDGEASVVVAERDLKLLVATPVRLGRLEGPRRHLLGGVAPGQFVVADGAAAHQHLAMH